MRSKSEIKNVYERWLKQPLDSDIKQELEKMDEAAIEDAFYCDLAFGTGGLRGTIGAGTNRMNNYVVAKASQGLSSYLLSQEARKKSVVIGYDSRMKSDVFAKKAASVFAANGIKVHLWSELNPVPTVSYAVRYLLASAGVMITASHNPSKYNGYKVYDSDGCQITTEAAKSILSEINDIDIFKDVKTMDFDTAVEEQKIRYIESSVLDSYIKEVKKQSVLFSAHINKSVSIVYTPLNGTGLKPVTRVLEESGYTSITVVEEQKNPDGNFPTCPYPNPEVREAMELGLKYAADTGADLLLATDPDADRCGIAVRTAFDDYTLLSGNEVGLLLLDYICSQRMKHHQMPVHPVFIKTIVTMDLAEKIASQYGVRTINVLTGFKFIGEQIRFLEEQGCADDFIFAFEESYGYLTGSYVRDKDAVSAVFMICEMYSFYATQGISLLDRIVELYRTYGFCLNTLHSYGFPGSAGIEKIKNIMNGFRAGIDSIAGMRVVKTEDYSVGLNNLPKSDVIKLFYSSYSEEGHTEGVEGSVVIRPSGTEPKLKAYISVTAENRGVAEAIEKQIVTELEERIGN